MRLNSDYRLVKAILQKERFQLLKWVQEKDRNISELARLSKLDRATVSYHLGVLQHNKLIKSEYKMLRAPHSMGKIGRYYSLNKTQLKKAENSINKFGKSMNF